jgi:hypothetical protein
VLLTAAPASVYVNCVLLRKVMTFLPVGKLASPGAIITTALVKSVLVVSVVTVTVEPVREMLPMAAV